VVFRRDNKVDSFQRQMSALRNQLGNTDDELDPAADEMPELDDEEYTSEGSYRGSAAAATQDSGAYSFGNYPAQTGQAPSGLTQGADPALPEMPTADGSVSVVARDTSWKGDINSETSIHVFGRINGTLTAREDVWIAEGAEVEATITAQRIIVAGNVSGSLIASGRFEALPSGRISADVSSPISVVHEGAMLNGNFRAAAAEPGNEGRPERTGAASVIQRRTRNAS